MSELKAKDPLSLQYLINEDIYLIDPIVSTHKPSSAISEAGIENNLSETSSFDYLGENNKYFLLLVDYSAHQTMPPKDLEALQNILGAKKMELKDVAILNLNRYPFASIDQLKNFFACNKVVLFGINPKQINLPVTPSNEVNEYQGIKVLSTFSFTEMLEDIEKKKIFWSAMKNL